jgi:hypothetical protein
MVEIFIAALVNSVTTVLAGTFVAPLPGRIVSTKGWEFGSAVVKVNWLLVFARALRDRS